MTARELRAWRLARDLSWSRAAEFAGVHPRTWAKWERSERSIPHWLPRILDTYMEKSE